MGLLLSIPKKQFCDHRYGNDGTWPLSPVLYGIKKIEIATPTMNYSATWMTENLKYYPGDDFKYSVRCSSSESCSSEGCLYTFAAAVGQPESVCGKNGSKYNVTTVCTSLNVNPIQGVCPKGWRVPGRLDWQNMLTSDGLYGIRLPKAGEGHYYYVTKAKYSVESNEYELANGSLYWSSTFSEVYSANETNRKRYAVAVASTEKDGVNYVEVRGTGHLANSGNPDVGESKEELLYVRCVRDN